MIGDLGQVLFHPFELRDEESVKKVYNKKDLLKPIAWSVLSPRMVCILAMHLFRASSFRQNEIRRM